MNSLAELAKAIGKLVLVGGVGAWVVWHNRAAALQLVSVPVAASIPQMGHLIGASFMMIVGAMLLIVTIDVPYQLYEHNKKLKMTKQEVCQESKETEDDPMVQGRIRSLQREAARRRMMAAIPTADVVVTNPTHYAVALKYSEMGMRAPRGGSERFASVGGSHQRNCHRKSCADFGSTTTGASLAYTYPIRRLHP